MKKKSDLFFVYIMTNQHNTVFYTGITDNLRIRTEQHKQQTSKGFTSQYNINKLLYFETFQDPLSAIEREKQIKRWRREKKLKLIRKENPGLKDVSNDL